MSENKSFYLSLVEPCGVAIVLDEMRSKGEDVQSQDPGVVSPRFRRSRCSYFDRNITFASKEKAQWSGLYECVTCHVCNAVYWLEDVGQRA